MPNEIIELRSDTKTRPSEGMRAAMAAAKVGDEQSNEDPSVNALCERIAALLGKSRGIFVPSGTMCNLIAVMVHCRYGDEILAADVSHLMSSESGGAGLSGALIRALPSERGVFTGAQVTAALRPNKINAPKSRLVHVEQTVNRGGGSIWSLDALTDVVAAARAAGLAVHMDGARVMNAVVATNVAAAQYGELVDSLWLDLSKGLGCPVGAVLVGDDDFIAAARQWKFRLGGAMRQAGVIAAAGLYALDHNIERLRVDHDNARLLADRLRVIPGVTVLEPQTNIVFFDVGAAGIGAADLARELAKEGILIGPYDKTSLRAVTHLDVDAAGIEAAARAVARIVARAAH
ncbi:MAG TPA: GntG family PLP-dependent aldolase [Xanthobacteraceae bacterium]|nr:GntG family PLP-dependent aldolase [Xanthobacteraceae bacterium]